MTFADLSPLANHLWQSTLFAAVAWLLTLALRKNRASVRYWIWLAASVKFLIPFSLLVSAGAQLGWRTAPVIAPSQLSFAMDQISQPFAMPPPTPLLALPVPPQVPLAAILVTLWLCGIAAGIGFWMVRWRQFHSIRRTATPLDLNLPIRVMSSPARMEPGVVGIVNPVLLVPEGIAEHLTPAQLEAILAHELRHVQRRDNLTAAIHMLVETIFWFHPLVWWIRTRLMEERERACDEGVLMLGSEPQVYAESILKVCEFYLASRASCAAGVTGGELKKRIEGIMSNPFTRKLSYGKKMLLASAATLVVSGPIVIGLLRAQAPRFEVASVKPSAPRADGRITAPVVRGGPGSSDPALARFENIDLFSLVAMAYGIQRVQLSAPEWLNSARFDIDARVPQGATTDQYRLMLQNLLAERFKLALHHETKEMQTYELVVAKNGPKMKESEADPNAPNPGLQPPAALPRTADGAVFNGAVQIRFAGQTMERFAAVLARFLGAPVTDATGLKGSYDGGMLHWSGNGVSSSASDAPDGTAVEGQPTLMQAVQEQLGLRLVPKKGSVDALVVDHIEKVSTEN